MVDRFEAIAYEHIPARGGRVVKTIGDAVMFAADDAAAAAEIALGLVEAHARDAAISRCPCRPRQRAGAGLGRRSVRADGESRQPAGEPRPPGHGAGRRGARRAAAATTPRFTLRHLRPVRLQGIGRVRSWVLRRAG